jgi:hypothetical protein
MYAQGQSGLESLKYAYHQQSPFILFYPIVSSSTLVVVGLCSQVLFVDNANI